MYCNNTSSKVYFTFSYMPDVNVLMLYVTGLHQNLHKNRTACNLCLSMFLFCTVYLSFVDYSVEAPSHNLVMDVIIATLL